MAAGLIDFNPSVQRFHLDRVRAYLDLVYELEGRNLLLVLGEYIWNREVIPPAEQWRTGADNCRRLAERAEELGIEIVLEFEPFPSRSSTTSTGWSSFSTRWDNPAVRANIDVSHLHLARVAPAELQKLRGKAIHVHISDCDGKVHGDLPPGRGVVDFVPYLREIKSLGIDGAISIELEYAPEPDKINDWVTEAYRETDRLLQQVGLRG